MTVGSLMILSSTPWKFDDPIATVMTGTREESTSSSPFGSTRAALILMTVSPLRKAWCMRRVTEFLGCLTAASENRTIAEGGRMLGGYGLGVALRRFPPPGGR